MAEDPTSNGISRRIRTVNWPQAFAEVLLLLAGIGLALSADWWAGNEREKDEETQYLIALKRDFSDTRLSLEQSLLETRNANRKVVQFMEILQGPRDAISEDELAVYRFHT